MISRLLCGSKDDKIINIVVFAAPSPLEPISPPSFNFTYPEGETPMMQLSLEASCFLCASSRSAAP